MHTHLYLLALTALMPIAASDDAAVQAVPPDTPVAEPTYREQSLHVATPKALEFWVASPVREVGGETYPWNIVRMWYPEAAAAQNEAGESLWRLRMPDDPGVWTQQGAVLSAEWTIPGGRLLRSVESRRDELHFTLTFDNTTDTPWKEANAGSCLQLSAAPDYEDNIGERTYWVLDGELVPTQRLAITDAGMRGWRSVGQTVAMKDGTTPTISEGAVFVQSKDGRYVMGYSWQPAAGLFYNRAGIVACNHVSHAGVDVPAHSTRSVHGLLFVHEGTLDDAYQRFLDWKRGLANNRTP